MKSVKVVINDDISANIEIEDRDVSKFLKIVFAFNTQTKKPLMKTTQETKIDNTTKETEMDEVLSSCRPNAFFKEIYHFLSDNFPITKKEPKKVMVSFYTHSSSQRLKGERGLAWLYYPIDSTTLKLYLRNTRHIGYPESLTNRIIDYKISNRDYPIFTVRNKSDMEVTKELIQFAYDNY